MARRRGIAVIVAGTLALTGLGLGMARATSSLDEAFAARRFLRGQLVMLHERLHDRRVELKERMRSLKKHLPLKMKAVRGEARSTYQNLHRRTLIRIRRIHRKLHYVTDKIRAHMAKIRMRRQELTEWIDIYGIFRYCPVAGTPDVNDNFGAVVDLPGVPKHIHQGNDIGAPSGTPIVAPFDGVAVATAGELGGLSVVVQGGGGHVYNAHLSGYGRLGPVQAGDIVGYVGATGDATSPHDHFEWHPGDGVAVDPYPYLAAAC